jgi:hypothetical protein
MAARSICTSFHGRIMLISKNCRYVDGMMRTLYGGCRSFPLAESIFFPRPCAPAILVCSVSSDNVSFVYFSFLQSLCWQIEWRLNRRSAILARHTIAHRRMNVHLVDQLGRRIQIAGRLFTRIVTKEANPKNDLVRKN